MPAAPATEDPVQSTRRQTHECGIVADSSQSPARILIVDDDPAQRTLMREVLGDAGFTVEQAVDGNQAVELWRSFRPDLVVLDIDMPGRDGFSACAEMRRHPLGRDRPVVRKGYRHQRG